MIRERSIARAEECGCANDLALLVMIDGEARLGETRGLPISDFNKHEALLIEHDQVDFSTAGAKVPCNRAQPLVDEKSQGVLLGVIA